MAAHERYRSAEQLLERAIRDMGDELGPVYNALSNQLAWLHMKWALYRQLYARSTQRVELLNKAAGHCFGVLQRALMGDVLLHISRVTDRQTVAGRENLTIRRLPSLVPESLRAEIEALLATAIAAVDAARELRNRRLAHIDLESIIADTDLPGISREQVESAAAALRALLNRLELHYWQSTTMYADTITPAGDGDSLVYYLRKGIRAEEGRHQRLLEGTPRPEDLNPAEELP